MINIAAYSQFMESENSSRVSIDVRRILQGSGVGSVPFSFAFYVILKGGDISVNGATSKGLKVNYINYVENRWMRMEYPSGKEYLLFEKDNENVKVDDTTGAFIFNSASPESGYRTHEQGTFDVYFSYELTPQALLEIFEKLKMQPTDLMIKKLQRVQKVRNIFGK